MKILCVILFGLFFMSISAYAQELYEMSNEENRGNGLFFEGFVRGVAWGGGERYDFANLSGELALRTGISKGNTFLKADVRFRDGLFMDKQKMVTELKEAYCGYRGQYFDIYAGKQIVVWGRTDGFNPTNNLNPSDYFLLTPDPDDQKIGNFMLRSRIRPFNWGELELIAIPLFIPSVYRYDLFDLGSNVSFDEATLPGLKIRSGAIAARFNLELSNIGFSLSYFDGYDPFYGFKLQSFAIAPQPVIVYKPDFYRKKSYGMDFAYPLKSFIFRGEVALDVTKDYEEKTYVPNPNISYVLGIERELWKTTAILQYIGKYTLDYAPAVKPSMPSSNNPAALYDYALTMAEYETEMYNRKIMNQQEKTSHALFLSLSRQFSNEMFKMNFSTYYNLTSEEYFLRPELKWKINDALTAVAGIYIMDGPENSIFRHAGKVLDGVYSSLTVNF